jgi:flavin reductase (NADH)/flavin reductase/chlorophenol-4-monooxygenase component 1
MPNGARIGLSSAPLCGSTAVSAEQFRGAFAQFATTVSVIATDGAGGRAGVTCSAVCAVSDNPATLLVCVHGKSAANPIIKKNGVLSVNCLEADQRALSQAFAGIGSLPMPQRFALAQWEVLATGAPYCRNALVALDCDLTEVREVGTHSIFIAQVVATAARPEGTPLIYQRRAYATTRTLA